MAKGSAKFSNPFRPGAGHMPPYLAGREHETDEFREFLEQETILKNLVLTGLRGLGKTVLLERFKPMAIEAGWLWAGNDLSESTSISEENLCVRIMADLAVLTGAIVVKEQQSPGFTGSTKATVKLDYDALMSIYTSTPGLNADKIKGVLEQAWTYLAKSGRRGIIFAYDEAQNLADHSTSGQYPLSLLLDVFQSIQRKGIPFMLALTGLPTLFPKLVEARTFAERMFHQIFLNPLTEAETTEAIQRPIQKSDCPFSFLPESIKSIWATTRGYPYFVQYVCREVFDTWVQAVDAGKRPPSIPISEIVRKLDSDFFSGRWARATDRQRDLLRVIAQLSNSESEFAVQDIIESVKNTELDKPFSGSHVNQMLASLSDSGLVYKNRHGKYSFAVPLLGGFIMRQKASG